MTALMHIMSLVLDNKLLSCIVSNALLLYYYYMQYYYMHIEDIWEIFKCKNCWFIDTIFKGKI